MIASSAVSGSVRLLVALLKKLGLVLKIPNYPARPNFVSVLWLTGVVHCTPGPNDTFAYIRTDYEGGNPVSAP